MGDRPGVPNRAGRGGRELPGLILDLDASLVVCHSEKESAAPTFKSTFGYHPLMAFCDNTGEFLAAKLRSRTTPGRTPAPTTSRSSTPRSHRSRRPPPRHPRSSSAPTRPGAPRRSWPTSVSGDRAPRTSPPRRATRRVRGTRRMALHRHRRRPSPRRRRTRLGGSVAEVLQRLSASPRDAVLFVLLTLRDVGTVWVLARTLGLADPDTWTRLVAGLPEARPARRAARPRRPGEHQPAGRRPQLPVRRSPVKTMREPAAGSEQAASVDVGRRPAGAAPPTAPAAAGVRPRRTGLTGSRPAFKAPGGSTVVSGHVPGRSGGLPSKQSHATSGCSSAIRGRSRAERRESESRSDHAAACPWARRGGRAIEQRGRADQLGNPMSGVHGRPVGHTVVTQRTVNHGSRRSCTNFRLTTSRP